MKGAEALVWALEKQGVKYVFGTPGSTEVPILDAFLGARNLQYILTLHESVAQAMADGYAKASRRPGVVNVHAVVGTANLLGNMYNSYRDRTPVVITAGNKDTRMLGHGCFCEAPQFLEMVRPVTKWTWETRTPHSIPEAVARAIMTSMVPPEGPTFLSFPEDLLETEIGDPGYIARNMDTPGIRPDPVMVSRAAEVIAKSKSPVIIVGNEVGRSKAVQLAVEFAEYIQAPVFTEERTALTHLNFPHNHPLWVGPFDRTSELLKDADLVFALGPFLFMDYRYSPKPHFPTTAKLVQVHSDPAEIGKIYPVDVPLVGDCKLSLYDLLEAAKSMLTRRPKLDFEPGINKRNRSRSITDEGGIQLEDLVSAMERALPKHAIVVDEGIRSSWRLVSSRMFSEPDSYFHSAGGYLGWGLPASLGVKLAYPDRPVVGYIGDGSFIFGVQALWTAAKYKIPVITIVCNNRAYMAVRQNLIKYQGRAFYAGNYIGTHLDEPAPDLVSISEGFGVKGLRITKSGEIEGTIEEALNSDAPVVLDVRLDPKCYL